MPITLHLSPGHYWRTQKLVHLVQYDLAKVYKAMAHGQADDKTILENRDQVIVIKTGNAINVTETNTRQYGGEHPEPGEKIRTVTYDGTIAPDGVLTPPQAVLEDAGDGALDQLPDIPLAPGQQWTFSRTVKAERDLGVGPMTYLDKVEKIEERNGHRIALIDVTGNGQMTPPKDMEARGFKAAPMDLTGTAEFDTTTGLPGVQHYAGKATWTTKVMGVHIGVIFDDTYDSAPLQPGAPPPTPAPSSAPSPTPTNH
ncbi:MAG: hypothetical protein JOY86_01315 [Candidatus Eremiobacteraeota bacterium]|nr:hypothetical protein [Candidatus Eremiobacteraeota bacterium]